MMRHKRSHSRPSYDIDLEAQVSGSANPRFVYQPTSFIQRLLVGVRIKNKLDTSRIVRIPFRVAYKYSLIITLLLIGAFLTPQLLPRWIGFEWASPDDLCQAVETKLNVLEQRLINMTRLNDAKLFLEQQRTNFECMEKSAANFYHGENGTPPRYQWPDECNSDKAKVSLSESTCVSQDVNVCSTVGGFAGFLISLAGSCQQQVGPELCLETTDKNRTEALLELERKRDSVTIPNTTEARAEPIAATANTKVQELIARLMIQVDVASDAFILYSIISIAVGIPLVVYKREKSSRIVGATFGLTKISFVIVFIVILSVYDSAVVILKETDFARFFQNFLVDPCYVDPRFSSRRVALIVQVCNNVSLIEQQSDHILQRMDSVYYDTRLFGFCKDDIRKLTVHPSLSAMDKLRNQYRSGDLSSPGQCNSTQLNQRTSIAPNDGKVSKFRALLGSGVVAQLLLKFILTSFILHLVAFVEPLVPHNGKVEVWGSRSDQELNEEEQLAVSRFARDKHLLPLLVFGLLLVIEVILIIYSIATTLGASDEITSAGLEPSPSPTPLFTCPSSLVSS